MSNSSNSERPTITVEEQIKYRTEKLASAPDPTALNISGLTFEEISKVNRRSQLDGVAAGTCAGFLGFATSRILKQNKNLALISGLMTGVITGYLFTQASLTTHMAQASLNATQLRDATKSDSMSGEMPEGKDSASWRKDVNLREGGSTGQETMHDKYNTTSGNH